MESLQQVELKANTVNILNGVQVVVAKSKQSRLEVQVNNSGDEYDTKLEVGDKVWLGDTRWQVAAIMESSSTFVDDWPPEAPLAILDELPAREETDEELTPVPPRPVEGDVAKKLRFFGIFGR